MKRITVFLFLLHIQCFAMGNFREVYPPTSQMLVDRLVFAGDRHGDFVGNDIAVLADGSKWKIHPEHLAVFSNWYEGDPVHIAVRTSFYWFKREHKFFLCNDFRNQMVPVMIVGYKTEPLRIVATENYYKSTKAIYQPYYVTETDVTGARKTTTHYQYRGQEPTDFRKVIILSDGSSWVIKEHVNEFLIGMEVYVGAQGRPNTYYDFILISGTEREAIWTWARPHKR